MGVSQHQKSLAAYLMLACVLILSACTTQDELIDSDMSIGPKKENEASRALTLKRASDLLYVTDRAPIITAQGAVTYGSERARSISFGTVSLADDQVSGREKVATNDVPLHVTSTTLLGKFPPSPYAIEMTPEGPRRTPAVVAAHELAAASLHAEVSRRLSLAMHKELVIFIHGYNNDFDDAAVATGDICRTLSSEFVCIVLTWPAGGSGGAFQGYNIDRESGEFAVADLKRVIRIVSETPGVERVHLVAHSRGTDVLVSAIQQLGIEAYASRSSPSLSFKIANIILFAPDIDLDVAESKLFGVVSDPGMSFGGKPAPAGVFPPLGDFHLTVYSSPNDKALALSSWLFGSVVRLGRLSSTLTETQPSSNSLWENSNLSRIADFIEYDGGNGFVGHSYFLSDRLVNKDMVALIRDRIPAGDPRRPLVEVKRPFWRVAEARKAAN
jgi:esterase/lipase superfamily enzyme